MISTSTIKICNNCQLRNNWILLLTRKCHIKWHKIREINLTQTNTIVKSPFYN